MFQFLVILLSSFLSLQSLAQEFQSHYDIETAKARCTQSYDKSQKLYSNNFKWGYTLLEMEDKFYEIYDSGKRLNFHANYNKNEDAFYLYLNRSTLAPVKINEQFIESVTRQIEIAIAKGYSDFVFFPDMGHSHLYIPQEKWDTDYANFKGFAKNMPLLYEKMLADPEMKPLYHLTEQLQMLDHNNHPIEDDILKFKYWHRNFLGKNDTSHFHEIHRAPKDEKYNTVRKIKDHKLWSAGFAVSASEQGCFPYRDKDGNTRYFDISLHDPEFDPSQMSVEDFGR